MTSVNDPQNYSGKFQNQLEKLATADIDDRDRDAIRALIRREDAEGRVNEGTMISVLNRLRLSAERAATPLVDMSHEDVDELLFRLRHDYDLSNGTLRNYRKALRKFFDHRGCDWSDDITVGAPEDRTVDPDELLTNEEIDELLDAADTPRDKALIALMADTGLRISAIASLRIRDVDLQGQTAFISINEEANVKDASGRMPLTWSEGYLASWLDVHPRRSEPDVAVIHKRSGWRTDPDDDGAMSYQYLTRRVKAIAEDAGIERDRVATHNFRKTAISRWIREGMSEQAIRHRACWDPDSDMFQIYSGVRDEELNEQILEHYDMAPAGEPTSRPDLDHCPRCHTGLRSDAHYCPGCAAPLTDKAVEATDDVDDQLRDLLIDEDDRDRREAAAQMATAIEENPRVLDELLDTRDT